MTDAKHTPGPWAVYKGDRVQSADRKTLVCDCFLAPGGVMNRIAQANARFIAAAPELLEAAKLARDALRSTTIEGMPDLPVTKALDMAIRKAEGESE